MCLGVDDPASWLMGAYRNCVTQVMLHDDPPAAKVNIDPFPSKPNSLDGNHLPKTNHLCPNRQPTKSNQPAKPSETCTKKTDARLAERHQAKVTKRLANPPSEL